MSRPDGSYRSPQQADAGLLSTRLHPMLAIEQPGTYTADTAAMMQWAVRGLMRTRPALPH